MLRTVRRKITASSLAMLIGVMAAFGILASTTTFNGDQDQCETVDTAPDHGMFDAVKGIQKWLTDAI